MNTPFGTIALGVCAAANLPAQALLGTRACSKPNECTIEEYIKMFETKKKREPIC